MLNIGKNIEHDDSIKIISVRENKERAEEFIRYFQKRWASEKSMAVYENCIKSCLDSASPLPQWYLLMCGDEIIGGAGLITNDFISRMDLYPWICALYVEEKYRCRGCGGMLLEKAKKDALNGGFENVYLCTDHIGYYERYGFEYIGDGYHPWGESSRIYKASLRQNNARI